VERNEDSGPEAEEGFPLIEGRLLGWLLYPYAMAEVERVPPANDPEAPEAGGAP
jgi:hypothetical protein